MVWIERLSFGTRCRQSIAASKRCSSRVGVDPLNGKWDDLKTYLPRDLQTGAPLDIGATAIQRLREEATRNSNLYLPTLADLAERLIEQIVDAQHPGPPAQVLHVEFPAA